MHACFLPKSSTQSQDTMFLLRSMLNSHGLSILQKSSNRSLQSQKTVCYSHQVLGISSPPGALPTRTLTHTGQTHTGSGDCCNPLQQHHSFTFPLSISSFPLTPHQSGLRWPAPSSTEMKVHFLLLNSKA